MKLKKAIRHLTELQLHDFVREDGCYKKAILLGIEALKEVGEARKLDAVILSLLPGETSEYMTCPKCGEQSPYGYYIDGKWIERKEPWACPNCQSLIVTDKEKGYGLRVESDTEL
ncbi:hypothetical protein LCGC14_1251390 [marine sediment metagenome]|uniref:Uncharacterized protein n=1 Tax=marine sediment metagenome TaxID=412755 RepID=A0A0F9L6H6_9ZZZZ